MRVTAHVILAAHARERERLQDACVAEDWEGITRAAERLGQIMPVLHAYESTTFGQVETRLLSLSQMRAEYQWLQIARQSCLDAILQGRLDELILAVRDAINKAQATVTELDVDAAVLEGTV